MVRLYVRPYVKDHKNDDRDAEAIAEAATRTTIAFVTIKSEEQFDLQALHRARERLVSDRTRLINQGREFLMERGLHIGASEHRSIGASDQVVVCRRLADPLLLR